MNTQTHADYLIGKKVKVTSDNECYDSFRDKTLIIIHVARSTAEHPGYDGVNGEPLCDFVAEDGTEIHNSLYSWEFKVIR